MLLSAADLNPSQIQDFLFGSDLRASDQERLISVFNACLENDANSLKEALMSYTKRQKALVLTSPAYGGRTALHVCALRGHAPCLKVILQNDREFQRNPNSPFGWSPLHVAASKGFVACVRLLLKNPMTSLESEDTHGRTPFHHAAQHGDIECVAAFLDDPRVAKAPADNDWKTPLHLAAETGHAACVRLMLRHPDTMDTNDEDGRTALHLAALSGHAACAEALLGDPRVAKAPTDNEWRTPLHLAAENGHVECVKTLLRDPGTPTDAEDEDGRTALHLAARAGHAACLEALLGDPMAPRGPVDTELKTPLHLAAENGHAACVGALLGEPMVPRAPEDTELKTPLHMAAENGHVACVKNLLRDPNTPRGSVDQDGRTALHLAAIGRHAACAKAILEDSVACMDRGDRFGSTPFDLSSAWPVDTRDVVMAEFFAYGYPIPGDASPALLAAAVAAGSSRVASLRPEAVDAAQARLMAALSATVGDDDRHARLRAIGLTGWSKDVISIDAAPGEGAQSADVASRTFAHARARVLVACAGEAERDAAVRSVEILAEIFPPAWLQQPGQTEMGMRLRSRASGTAAVRRRAMYAAAMCVGRWGEIVAERRYAESAEATAAAALREEAAVASEIVRLLEQKQGPARVVIS